MLKIQENYFYKLDNLKEVKIIWKKYDKANILEIGVEYPTAIVDLDRLSGIPLTKEMLLKYGFEKDEHHEHWLSLKLPLIKFIDLENTGVENKISIFGTHISLCSKYIYHNFTEQSFTLSKIEYLHELQNLYFTLTNEELQLC